jgi:large subunit ribosomal protein L14
MIQSGTYLNVIDNSGAKKVMCIKIVNTGYKQRYADIGSILLTSIKTIKNSKSQKVKKGEMHKALVVRQKSIKYSKVYNYKRNFENSVILLNKQNKLLGTRIFGTIPKQFKFSKFLKLTTLSSGLSV